MESGLLDESGQTTLNWWHHDLSPRTVKALAFANIFTLEALRDAAPGIRELDRIGGVVSEEVAAFLASHPVAPDCSGAEGLPILAYGEWFSIRTVNALAACGIKEVGQLIRFCAPLHSIDGFGRKAVEEVATFMRDVRKGKIALSRPSYATLRDAWEKFVSALPSREKTVAEARFVRHRTLEDVAGDFGITRERIRQIEKGIRRAFGAFAETFLVANPDFESGVRNIIEREGSFMLPDDMGRLDKLGFLEDDALLAFHALSCIFPAVSPHSYGPWFLVSEENARLTDPVMKELFDAVWRRLEKNNADLDIATLAGEHRCEDRFSHISLDFLRPLLAKIVTSHPDYSMREGWAIRDKKRYRLREMIQMILADHPDGLHFTEIAKTVSERFDALTAERKVHAQLCHADNDSFVNIGLGIWALAREGGYSGLPVNDVIYALLREGGAPLEMAAISEYVLAKKRVNPNTVEAALHYPKEDRFVRYEDGRVGLREWGLPGVATRAKPNYEFTARQALSGLIADGGIALGEYCTLQDFVAKAHAKYGESVSLDFNNWKALLNGLIENGACEKGDFDGVQYYAILNKVVLA